MESSAHTLTVETFVPMLRTLSTILDKGAEHAAARAFDPAVLVNARLAPDMFPLSRQVQIASDIAKGAVARLAGKESPTFEDDERTMDELKARIEKTIGFLESVPASAFEGAEDRDIEIQLRSNLVLKLNGARFLRDWALPNFYFHLVTAYDILRHNGVEIGKQDYLAHVGDAIQERAPEQQPGSAAQ